LRGCSNLRHCEGTSEAIQEVSTSPLREIQIKHIIVRSFAHDWMIPVKKQVIYLNLFQFKFPATAIVSILHRLSGVFLFLALPGLLWALSQSLQGEPQFSQLKDCFMHPVFKWIWAAFLVALFYHLMAGIRHIIIDMGYAGQKQSGRIGAYLVMVVSGLFALWLGSLIW
jgi:succinate dehydrogenase / fumarate reductase cytochrome b subunit